MAVKQGGHFANVHRMLAWRNLMLAGSNSFHEMDLNVYVKFSFMKHETVTSYQANNYQKSAIKQNL